VTRYVVYLHTVASTAIYVETDDMDEAGDLAFEQPLPRICAQCAGFGGGPSLDLGEWEVESVEEAAAS